MSLYMDGVKIETIIMDGVDIDTVVMGGSIMFAKNTFFIRGPGVYQVTFLANVTIYLTDIAAGGGGGEYGGQDGEDGGNSAIVCNGTTYAVIGGGKGGLSEGSVDGADGIATNTINGTNQPGGGGAGGGLGLGNGGGNGARVVGGAFGASIGNTMTVTVGAGGAGIDGDNTGDNGWVSIRWEY